MSHPQQLAFIELVRKIFPSHFNNKKVLEIGSLNINGSVRPYFTNCDYLGIDVGEGKDVDLVCHGDTYDAPNDSYNVTISCECFEHNPQWVETFQNMIRLTESNGLVIMTCATEGRPEHGTTRTTPADSPLTLHWDYYKNLTIEDFKKHFNFLEIFKDFDFIYNLAAGDLYFYGIKR